MLNLHSTQHVLVLGLGDSGLAMARWVSANGAARVQVWDSRAQAPQDATLAAELPGVQRLQGELTPEALQGVALLLKSPGLAPGDARIAPLLAAARAQGIPVQGELDLFAQALAALKANWRYSPGVLAITGTNGKTTTTALTARLCAAAGRRVGVAGNIGPTLLDTLAQALQAEGGVAALEAACAAADAATAERRAAALNAVPAEAEVDVEPTATLAAEATETPPTDAAVPAEPAPALPTATEPTDTGVSLAQLDALLEAQALPIAAAPPQPPRFAALPDVWVLELSSFQLDGVSGFQPSAATVLNLSQDHLDWHGSMDAYGAAKARIFGSADPAAGLWLVNRDDPLVEALLPQAPPAPIGARGKPLKVTVKWQGPRVARFGLNPPRAPGDFGLLTESGIAWLVRALPADDTPVKGRRGARAADDDLTLQRLMPADALRIRGRHNAANALAALALATEVGCAMAPMLHALREYRGEPHRVEPILSLDGIEFVDDSKGTNVGATVAAIAGLAADRESARLSLILGGDGKGQDFAPLLEPIRQHARAISLIGRDGPALQALLEPLGLPTALHADLPSATRWAFAQALEGDTVLLSPACASLDMFKNYAHRAQVFADTARELALERGALA